jgi:hypothetical protein
VLVGLVALLAGALLVGCMPQDKGAADEVGDGLTEAPAAPPKFPDTGPVSAELLVEGLVYDFTSAPTDLNLWTPPADQARCAAQKIVQALGAPRLSELGYRPATSGASLNDIDLSVAERTSVAQQFSACVDLTEGIAGLLMGDGHMESSQALCITKGLASQGLLQPFVEAWAFGRETDPFEDDGALATALISYSKVCLPNDAFTWNDADLPGDDDVQGTGVGSGTTTSTVPGTPDGLSSRTGSNTTVP